QGGWEYFSGSFYYKSSVTKSWQESRDACLQKGADLDFIMKFKNEIYWNFGEPNGGKVENCLEIRYYDSENGWNDLSCSNSRNWICELKALP
ncbi:hypothetical protein FQN60_005382, partial [Etheostoma spectabile]